MGGVGCIIELVEQISFEFSVRRLGQVSAQYSRGSRFLEAPKAEAFSAALIVITRRADFPCDPSRQKTLLLVQSPWVSLSTEKPRSVEGRRAGLVAIRQGRIGQRGERPPQMVPLRCGGAVG